MNILLTYFVAGFVTLLVLSVPVVLIFSSLISKWVKEKVTHYWFLNGLLALALASMVIGVSLLTLGENTEARQWGYYSIIIAIICGGFSTFKLWRMT